MKYLVFISIVAMSTIAGATGDSMCQGSGSKPSCCFHEEGCSSSAQSKDKTEKGISVAMPDPVLALQASSSLEKAMSLAREAIKKHSDVGLGGLEEKLIILGYSVKGSTVSLDVGAPTDMWPTSIYKIGEIKAEFRFFPDGVNGYEIEGEPVYVDLKKIELFVNRAQ